MSRLLSWLPSPQRWTKPVDLETLDREDIPDASGVYILLSGGIEYAYPWHESRVFYIGSSDKLRTRLSSHKKYYLEARANRRWLYYAPRYEYGANHGCKARWLKCSDAEHPKGLENNLLFGFAESHGAIPVANNQGAWERKLTRFTPERRLLNEVFNGRGRSCDVNDEGKETIHSVLSSLHTKKRKVLSLLFGLNDQRPMGPRQVGVSLGLSLKEVRQVQSDAIRELRHPTRARKLKDL